MATPKKLTNDELGELAQDEVKRWCSQRGIVANPATRDRKGWDLIAELPRVDTGDLETRPGDLTCFLQIKGTTARNGRMAVKLDNWENAVKRPIPFFFVVVEFSGRRVNSVAVVHVDQAWAARVMKRLRSLGPDAADSLHKRTMSLTWTTADRLGRRRAADFEDRVRSAIGADQAEYYATKRGWLDDPDSHVRVSVRTRIASDGDAFDAMADFAIGLRDELPVDILRIERHRFGLPTPEAEDVWGPGNMVLPELPVAGTAEITFTGHDFAGRTSIRCDVHSSKLYFPFLPDLHHKLRFRLPFLSIVVGLGTNQTNFVFDPPGEGAAAKLGELAAAAKIMEFLGVRASTGLSMDITYKGKPVNFRFDPQSTVVLSAEQLRFVAAIGHAASLAQIFGISLDAMVSTTELVRQRDALTLLYAASTGSAGITISSNLVGELESEPERALFVKHIGARIGNDALLGILVVEGPVAWTKQDGTWHFEIKNGQARLHGKWTVPVTSVGSFPFKEKLDAAVGELEDGAFVLCEPDK